MLITNYLKKEKPFGKRNNIKRLHNKKKKTVIEKTYLEEEKI